MHIVQMGLGMVVATAAAAALAAPAGAVAAESSATASQAASTSRVGYDCTWGLTSTSASATCTDSRLPHFRAVIVCRFGGTEQTDKNYGPRVARGGTSTARCINSNWHRINYWVNPA